MHFFNDKGMVAATPLELMNPEAGVNGWIFHLKILDGTISVGAYNRVTVFIDGMHGVSCGYECPWEN
jgi:hypothetical protein